MTGIAKIIGALEPVDDGWRVAVPQTWMQGRTVYGGLSSALALAVAQRSDVDLPPLRSAQVSFVGPLSGAVTIRAQRLRRGRTAAWVQATVSSDAGLGLSATFVFMHAQDSTIDHVVGRAPDFPPPDLATQIHEAPQYVVFAQHFEFVEPPTATLGPAEWLRWIRLRARDGLDPAVELIAVADCMPPAALKLVGGHAPVSSMTWQIDLLGAPVTDDGWWLLRADSDYARGGSSSQRMAIWNRAGQAVAEQLQSVAIFV